MWIFQEKTDLRRTSSSLPVNWRLWTCRHPCLCKMPQSQLCPCVKAVEAFPSSFQHEYCRRPSCHTKNWSAAAGYFPSLARNKKPKGCQSEAKDRRKPYFRGPHVQTCSAPVARAPSEIDAASPPWGLASKPRSPLVPFLCDARNVQHLIADVHYTVGVWFTASILIPGRSRVPTEGLQQMANHDNQTARARS